MTDCVILFSYLRHENWARWGSTCYDAGNYLSKLLEVFRGMMMGTTLANCLRYLDGDCLPGRGQDMGPATGTFPCTGAPRGEDDEGFSVGSLGAGK